MEINVYFFVVAAGALVVAVDAVVEVESAVAAGAVDVDAAVAEGILVQLSYFANNPNLGGHSKYVLFLTEPLFNPSASPGPKCVVPIKAALPVFLLIETLLPTCSGRYSDAADPLPI